MKQCPKCHHAFAYELLKFCRFDGSRLVSAPPEEATTRLLPPVQLSGEHVQAEAIADRQLEHGRIRRLRIDTDRLM